jgi:transcriptional regulator with PAS, ATPase and Fis domain
MENGDLNFKLWQKFINREKIDSSKVRPEILESWKRCLGRVDPFKPANQTLIPEKEFKKLYAKKLELINITYPLMKDLHDFVKDSGFSIGLLGVEGNGLYVLKSIDANVGDEEAILQCQNVNAVPGSDWSESAMGTWGGSMALYYDKPFQVFPHENFCQCLQDGTTCAVAIHDPDTGDSIGILVMNGTYDRVYPHTLGMVVAAVKSIEKQIATTRLKNRAELDNNYKNLIMESTPYGVISMDAKYTITHMNKRAINILGAEQDLIGQDILAGLADDLGLKRSRKLIDIIKSPHDVSDEFVHIPTFSGTTRCAVTTRGIFSDKKAIGKILIINEMSRLNDLVTRTFGNYARFTFNDIIGEEGNFVKSIGAGIQVSKTSSNVLLLGESGTGKDVFAQSIHNASSRKNQPYVAINCAAIPRDLLGSELFGYDEGSFTGARKGGSPGKFELADGGTLFLDEIGEMPLDMQTILLRVLEERAVTRIGGKISFPVDVRLIAATNKDLMIEAENGNFRSDLYYRLNVVGITLPPLRERRQDILLFINQMVEKISARLDKKIDHIDPEFIWVCSVYDWPGNVRELQNAIERCINLTKGKILTIEHLPERIKKKAMHSQAKSDNFQTLKSYGRSLEYSVIQNYLDKYGGNKAMVARELGITRTTLYRKLKEYS